MNGKRNFKQEIKETWDENKGKIKIGLVCLGIGTIYGFLKACKANTEMMSKLLDRIPYEPDSGDISEWIYSNLDKPEVLEEIRAALTEIDNF